MPLLNITAFAKLAGVSRTAIYKAISEGRLVQRKNKKLDPRNDTNRYFLSEHKAPAKDKNSKAKRTIKTADLPGYKPENLDLKTEEGITRSAAELQKVLTDIAHKEIKIKTERQMLIDRKLVQSLIGVLSAIDTNELLTIPGNVAPEIAGICGKEDNKTVLKVSKFIEKKLYGFLKHRKRVIKDWLKMVAAEVPDEENE